MTKIVLKATAVLLGLVMATLLVLYVNRSDPYGPLPGKRLRGEEVSAPVTDWSFVRQVRTVTIETRPSNPYSVHISYVFQDGVLYLSSGRGAESRWPFFIMADPRIRVRIGDQLYPVLATRVEDPGLIEAIHNTRDGQRPNQAPRSAEERARVWFFRVESRPPGSGTV